MNSVNRFGLLSQTGSAVGARDTEHEDFPMLAPETPPLPPGLPFVDDLDRCDRMMGVLPRPKPVAPRPQKRILRPDPAFPTPARSFVGPRVGYGAQLPPLTFTIRGGEYSGKVDPERRATMDMIFRAVEAAFVAKRVDMISPRRDRAATLPRFAVCLLAIEFTTWSLPRIGVALGGRDHTTILNAVHRARFFEQHDRGFAAAIEQARAALSGSLPPKEPRP